MQVGIIKRYAVHVEVEGEQITDARWSVFHTVRVNTLSQLIAGIRKCNELIEEDKKKGHVIPPSYRLRLFHEHPNAWPMPKSRREFVIACMNVASRLKLAPYHERKLEQEFVIPHSEDANAKA